MDVGLPTMPVPPQTLVAALKAGRALAIVGSGVSLAAGAPDWGGLMLGLAEEAERLCPRKSGTVREARSLLQNGAYLDCAAVLKEVLGPEFSRTVVRLVDQVQDPSPDHQILMQLPFRAIVTTNYDRLLERACLPGRCPPSWCWCDSALSVRVREGKQFILKLHGDIERPETIVLARDEYSRCVNHEQTREALTVLFGANVPFLIGYGHRDPDLDSLLDTLRERACLDGGFAVVSGDDVARNARFRDAKVFPIQLNSYGDVPRFLLTLAKEVGVQPRIHLTFVTDVAWTTPEAAQQIAHRLASALAAYLGCDASVRDVRPGSVRIVLELPGEAAVDTLNRVQHHDEFRRLLQKHRVTKVGSMILTRIPNSRESVAVAESVRTNAIPAAASGREGSRVSLDRSSQELSLEAALAQRDFRAAAQMALDAYGPEIRYFLSWTLSGNEDAVEEVFSEFALNLIQIIPKFSAHLVRPLCYRIARSAAARFRRDPLNHTNKRVPLADAELPEDLQAPSPDDQGDAWLKVAAQSLYTVIQELPEEERTLLLLRVRTQMSWDDIALALSPPDMQPTDVSLAGRERAMRFRYHRARKRVRKILMDKGLIRKR